MPSEISRPRPVLPVTLFALALIAPALVAQTVFFTGPNNQVNQGTFQGSTGIAVPVIQSSGTNLQGIAAREDGLLVVANSTQNGAVLACDAAAGPPGIGACATIVSFPQAGGLSLASDTSTIFATNAAPGGLDQVIAIPLRGGCPSGLAVGGNPACLPGGYDAAHAPIFIDPDVDQVGGITVNLLADVKFVPFNAGPFGLGDVAVLSQDPPMLFVYSQPGSGEHRSGSPWEACADPLQPPCEPSQVVPPSAFGGRQPRGFTFDVDNSILVTTKDGDILRFSGPVYDPGPNPPEVVASLPGSGAKIAVGIHNGEPKAFVAVQNGGVIQSYGFSTDGNGDGVHDGLLLEAQIAFGVSAPDGIASPSSVSFAALQAGANVTVNTSGLLTTWETIVNDGISLVQCHNFQDPRESTSPRGERLFLCHPGNPDVVPAIAPTCPVLAPSRAPMPDLEPSDTVLDLGLPVVVPAYMRAYRTLALPGDNPTSLSFPDLDPSDNDPELDPFVGPSGPPTLRICVATTTASFAGLITDIAQEEAYLGYDPAHPGGGAGLECSDGPRFLYATLPSNGDQEIPEGRLAIDTSFTCGFNAQGFFQRSVLIPNAIDERTFAGLRDVSSAADCSAEDGALPCKLANLRAVLESDPRCIRNPTRGRLDRSLSKAVRAFEMGDDETAQSQLCEFQAIVDDPAEAPAFATCTAKLRDHLRARVKSANHTLGLLRDPTSNFVCPAP